MSFSSRIASRLALLRPLATPLATPLARPRTAVLLAAATACASMAFACGGISDPTRAGETVATVSGALTGTSVPANARVALVWRTASSTKEQGGYAVGVDVPVVNGKFTMGLSVPAAAYFSSLDSGSGQSFGGTDTPPSSGGSGGVAEPAPAPADPEPGSSSSGGGEGFRSLTPKDNASGSIITQPLTAAVAGFVVYVDTNGNGKLDLSGQYASSTDTILGGNRELVLTYLKDGGQLDLEKLRDRSGIAPTAGFNLAWTDNGRWLPLNLVELKIDGSEGLPYPVCSTSGAYAGEDRNTVDPVESGSSSSGGSGTEPSPPDPDADGGSSTPPGTGYPDPSDPNLRCSADGTSFSYSFPAGDCPLPTPAPEGLCSGRGDIAVGCATGGGYGAVLPPDGSIPPGWPCTVSVNDAGPPPDGGPGSDGGPATDAGAPDSGP